MDTPGPFKFALVALDLTEMDDHLIQYAKVMTRLLPLERIHFVHIAKDLELPEDVLKKYPDLLAPLDESIEADIQKKIDKHFSDSEVEIKIIIHEGNPIEEILKLVKIKEVDLIIMGRKKDLKGSGLVTSHIARNSPCSLLLVTTTHRDNIHKILVPTDFSRHSLLSLKVAYTITETSKAELLLTHVYKVPTGYSKIGKSFEEFAAIMRANAEKELNTFLKANKLTSGTRCEYLLDRDSKNVDLIYELAEEEDVDLIVVGSKGRTNASAMFIGSFAEKLAYKDSSIPVLIVKGKGENMGFLETLLRI